MGISRWTDGLGTLHLSRFFRGSFAKFGCQKWQVQILNLNWALATVFNALYNPSCDTRLPQLRPKASTIPPVSTSRPFPLVHSHWTKQPIWNIFKLLFRDLSRSKLLSRSFATQHFSFAKWCSTTPLHKQYIEVFFVAHLKWHPPPLPGLFVALTSA